MTDQTKGPTTQQFQYSSVHATTQILGFVSAEFSDVS